MRDILQEAQDILGPPLKIDSRGWGIWWCPFHDDKARRGQRGDPNFGINIEKGYWKCLRCGAKGGSLTALKKQLGEWQPPPPQAATVRRHQPQVNLLDEALSEARAALLGSPGLAYLHTRGLRPYTSLVYGLGYGLPMPAVSSQCARAALESGLVRRDGAWQWAGGIVYADPPTNPAVINVRYIPNLPAGSRPFNPTSVHKTWGRRLSPLGSWRITTATRIIVVVEGLFDMLVLAQALHDRQMAPEYCPVYTNGASPSRTMLDWFGAAGFEFVLLPDPDEAGQGWTRQLIQAIHLKKPLVCQPAGDVDPDEAILAGWWPNI